MGKKEDIAARIAELQAEMDAADAAGDDYEVEIRDGDKSARVRGSQAAGWLHSTFGIGDPPAGDGAGEDGTDDKAKTDPPPAGGIWGRK